MAVKKRGLGRGLDILIPETSNMDDLSKNQFIKIDIEKIMPNPNQPRKFFETEKIDELAKSIELYGVIQPIIVKKIKKGYEIIAGERRFRASKKAKLKEIPCILQKLDPKEQVIWALIENVQRENLNAIEEGKIYKELMESYELTQEEVAEKVGKSRPYVTNLMRLLKLPDFIIDMIAEHRISGGHGKALLMLDSETLQIKIAEQIIEKKLSVREVEKLIKTLSEKKEKTVKKERDLELLFVEDELIKILGTKVNIIQGKKKGKIEIEYYSTEELNRLVELLQENRV